MAQDELTTIACLALARLSPIKKAQFLLNTALALIEDRRDEEEVKTYLDVCLKTPGLPKEDVKKVLLAQHNSRELAKGRLQPEPPNASGQVRSQLPCKEVHFSIQPACQRIPAEIWDQIGAVMPRYHLRKWLFISSLHRDIASRYLFHSIDMSFVECQILDRGLDILDRAINDPVFARRVKSLRLRVDYEEGDTLDILFRMLIMSLRAFKALRNFEWIGMEIPKEMAQILTHKGLHGLGLKGRGFEDIISSFHGLRKFGYHGEPEDDDSDLEDIRDMLDANESTLKHFILECHYTEGLLDSVFESAAINNLTHLDLSYTMDIPGSVLGRISEAKNLQSLTLCGSFEEPEYASQMFATYTIGLPHLESFRFTVEDVDEEMYYSVVSFLTKREKLRRLDLGNCPWDVIQEVLPTLKNLRVLVLNLDERLEEEIECLVKALPTQMVAIEISADSDLSLDHYVSYFTRFYALSFLQLRLTLCSVNPTPMPSGDERQKQINKILESIAAAIPSLDFLVWNDTRYVVLRSHGNAGLEVELKELPTNSRLEYGSGVDVISEDIAWLQHKTYRWNAE